MLHLVGLLFNVNYDARNRKLKKKKKISGSTKYGKFLEYLRNYQLLTKDSTSWSQ